MEELSWVTLGACFMSMFASLGVALLDDNKYWAMWLFGPFMWGVMLFTWIKDKIERAHRANYRALMVCPDGEIRWCRNGNFEAILEFIDGYEIVDQERLKKEGWESKFWPKKFRDGSYMSSRYVPRIVWEAYEPIDKEVVKKAKAKESKYLD